MTASQRRTVTVLVAALGAAFVLVWAASSGPRQVVGPDVGTPAAEQTVAPQQAPTAQAREDRGRGHEQGPAHRTSVGTWLQDLVAFALLLAGLVVVGLLLRELFVRIQRGLGEERLVVPMEPLPDLAAARDAAVRSRDRQQQALAGSDVRNAIVACWVVFEEAAERAHVPKGPAETASSFVVRFLHLLDVDPRPVGELSRLFLEARFSTHPLPADARARAEAALSAIHDDLVRSGTPHTGATP